jgi:hypothetical protein
MAPNATQPASYCLMSYGPLAPNETSPCRPFGATYPGTNTSYQQAFYAGLEACASYAIASGFTGTITLNPRIDQYAGGTWRAFLAFSPLAAHSGASYYDTVLQPHAALAARLAGGAAAWRLALGGEHLYTITAFPGNYSWALGQLRGLAPGAPRGPPPCLPAATLPPCCSPAAGTAPSSARLPRALA